MPPLCSHRTLASSGLAWITLCSNTLGFLTESELLEERNPAWLISAFSTWSRAWHTTVAQQRLLPSKKEWITTLQIHGGDDLSTSLQSWPAAMSAHVGPSIQQGFWLGQKDLIVYQFWYIVTLNCDACLFQLWKKVSILWLYKWPIWQIQSWHNYLVVFFYYNLFHSFSKWHLPLTINAMPMTYRKFGEYKEV